MASHESTSNDDKDAPAEEEAASSFLSDNMNTFLPKPITEKMSILEEDDQFVVRCFTRVSSQYVSRYSNFRRCNALVAW